jgi:hypothetical protein
MSSEPDGCWMWKSPLPDGYGLHRVAPGFRLHAHRFAYELFHGERAPRRGEGDIHHRCKNKACVNPWHLERLTISEHRTLHKDYITDMPFAPGHKPKPKPEHIAKQRRVKVLTDIPEVWHRNIKAYCERTGMDAAPFWRVGLRLAAKQAGFDLDKEE